MVLLARNIKRLEAVYDEIVSAGSPEPAAIPLDLLTASDEDFQRRGVQDSPGSWAGWMASCIALRILCRCRRLRDQGVKNG